MKEAVTKVIDTLTQEDFHGAFQKLFGTVQVHWSRRRLFRKGLEFHVCTINKSAHMKKNLETYLMILVYIIQRQVSRWWEPFYFRVFFLQYPIHSKSKSEVNVEL